ncbi:MAG: hypothetical protein AAB669_00820 [Patescibacteria group bacterium]
MYRTQIQKGDRIVLLPSYDGLSDYLREHVDLVLIADDVEEHVFDDGWSGRNVCRYLWGATVEATDEHLSFGSTSIRNFERIPLWEEVLGPLAPDWPPMTLKQFRHLPDDLQAIKDLIVTMFQEQLPFLTKPG